MTISLLNTYAYAHVGKVIKFHIKAGAVSEIWVIHLVRGGRSRLNDYSWITENMPYQQVNRSYVTKLQI